jgi:Flp pilus assembly protein TadD
MRKRTLIAILVAFVLTVGITALWSAEGYELDGDTDTNIVAASGAEAGTDTGAEPKKKGSKLGRFFKAPFKAVGRLFGGGDDNRKLARMREKDAERFESVGVVRVEDANNPTVDVSGDGTAKEHLQRGREALESGRLNEAIAELSRATSLDPRLSQAHNLLAVAYERKGLPDRASESFKRAVDIDDDDPQALNNLGYSLYVRGHYRSAVDKLKRAAKLAPGDNLILNNLALAQLRVGKYDDAYKNFARAGGEFNAHMNVAALLMRVGREERAIEHLEDARKLQPESTRVLYQLATLYDQTGRPDKAEAMRQALHVQDEKNQAMAVAGGQ